ncbi:MAG: diguanylate cyclase [Proteobacteria bacterium]|nr:diguanylate cyclase [Pseudomonadota bacterium]
MDLVRDSVLKCLNDFAGNDDKLIFELEGIVKEKGIETYSTILHVLTHLELEVEKAAERWKAIIEHRQNLMESLGRNVNLRTTICDYFCSIDISLRNPKVVEIHIFENKDKASKYDGLTGLYNRSYFDDYVDREMARAKRHDMDLSMLFFDLDNFKKVNDSYGHPAGDIILKSVAEIILDEIRTEDTAARYGGEEMVVILPQTGKIQSLILAERIREKVELMETHYQEECIRLTISGGVASFPMDADDGVELLKSADNALYEAKSSGKNMICMYSKQKRRYFRMSFNTEIEINRVDGEVEPGYIKGSSKNFSKAGILFESDHQFKMGDKIRLSIPLNKSKEIIKIIGTVVRVEVYGPDQYEIGVSFIEMGKSTENEIMRYMKRHFENIYL